MKSVIENHLHSTTPHYAFNKSIFKSSSRRTVTYHRPLLPWEAKPDSPIHSDSLTSSCRRDFGQQKCDRTIRPEVSRDFVRFVGAVENGDREWGLRGFLNLRVRLGSQGCHLRIRRSLSPTARLCPSYFMIL